MKKLVISLLGFIVVFHVVVIYIVVQKKYELTSPDYYAKEMDYQQEIEARQRASAYDWQVQYTENQVIVTCNQPIALKQPTLDLMKPNNARLDQELTLSQRDEHTWVATTQLERGAWKYTLKASSAHGNLQVEGRWAL